MKATNTNIIAHQAARFLKLAGLAMILISLLDLALLPIPPKLEELEWRLNLTSQIVERGIVPMLGMALVFSGYGFESLAALANVKRPPWKNIKLWVFTLAGFLGLIFLLLVPLHITTVLAANRQTSDRINQETLQAQKQLEERLQQQQTLISNLLKDNQKLDDLSTTNQLTKAQLAQLQQFKDNPKALKAQTDSLRSKLKADIIKRKQEALQRSKLGTMKSIVRIAVSSWLLASFYLTIAWTGFKSRETSQVLRRSNQLR
ncbi:MAG: HpsJ family protein [Actinomycetota bacterium]